MKRPALVKNNKRRTMLVGYRITEKQHNHLTKLAKKEDVNIQRLIDRAVNQIYFNNTI